MCLYSAASMWPRILSAASQSFFPLHANIPFADDGAKHLMLFLEGCIRDVVEVHAVAKVYAMCPNSAAYAIDAVQLVVEMAQDISQLFVEGLLQCKRDD